jgi:HAD superfamily hydrolase (TIGR01509 family)
MIETREALVFDYDGVIADTEPLHWKSWAALLLPYGLQFSWEDYLTLGLGVSDGEMYGRLRNQAPLPDRAEFASLNSERKRMVREWSLKEIPISQETIALLKSLGKWRVGLVTSSERSEVEPVLRAAAIYDLFAAAVFGDDVTAAKPAPEPYYLVAQRLGATTGIAFEDSENGLSSARAAGFRAIKVGCPQDLSQIVTRYLK